ncbi:MAG: D-lyxose/D-mannose family sugar isomerase [Fimbriimonadaceae bacterium]
MKRSEINQLVRDATACFERHGWTLPPNPAWDVTDFGLGDWRSKGLVLVNLAEEPEYCEKLMYAKRGMVTPAHTHAKKKEDIICRWGRLRLRLWKGKPGAEDGVEFHVQVNRMPWSHRSGDDLVLQSGERITLVPGVYHEFEPESDECIIGEVSTANDDRNDNFFVDPDIGRFPGIEEDEEPIVRLVSER